jgi:hypothetical protein
MPGSIKSGYDTYAEPNRRSIARSDFSSAVTSRALRSATCSGVARAPSCSAREARVLPDRTVWARIVGVSREQVPVQVWHAVAEQLVVQLAGREGTEHRLGDGGHLAQVRVALVVR